MPLLEPHMRKRLDEKFKKLQKLRPLDPTHVRKLHEQLQIEMTYNSNAIEGNSLTLRETYLVLNEGITIRGKPLKDHLEVKDHKEALDFLYDFIANDRSKISEDLIRKLHHLTTRETEGEWAGTFRDGAVLIVGTDHVPPAAFDIPREIQKLIRWLKKHDQSLHPIECAALLHHKLVYIHPFFDGNGRTARLLMNVILMHHGYPLTIILKNDRKKYYRVLQLADKGKLEPFVLFVTQAVERSLDLYLRAFSKSEAGRLLTLTEASRESPYSAKYLNLLVRMGKIGAFKRGRIWYTTKRAIEVYRQERLRKRAVNQRSICR